jgi:predicted RNase H-like nuclease (RuvC/YqgF family)
MDLEWITGLLTTFLGSVGGYFIGKRKSEAETDSIVIQNVKEVLAVYAGTINDLKKEIGELKDKIGEYEKHIERLENQLREFRNSMKS